MMPLLASTDIWEQIFFPIRSTRGNKIGTKILDHHLENTVRIATTCVIYISMNWYLKNKLGILVFFKLIQIYFSNQCVVSL